MNRIAGITLSNQLEFGHGVGYLTLETGVIESEQYELVYCAEMPLNRRFMLYTDNDKINLGQYLSDQDIARLNQVYFDFRTSNADITYITVQLKDCYALCVDVLAV